MLGMLVFVHVGLSLLGLLSESMCLPSPHDVRMYAVDLNYILHWEWSNTQLNVTFTADYAFSNEKDKERSYKRVCEGLEQRWCDFTHRKLAFSGSFQMRVRAEAGSEHSNWTYLRFIPDEDGQLGTPIVMTMKGDVDMIILTILSVMSSEMQLNYRVQYWEQLKPEQTHQKDYDAPYIPLTSLKSWTKYCLQVSASSENYNKNSNFTSPQCLSTTGRPLVWLKVLWVLCSLPLLGACGYFCYRFRRKFLTYKIPESILGLPSEHPLFLEAQEISCEVILMPLCLESTQLPQQEHQTVSCQWSGGSECDSGISSGQET